MGKNEPEQQGMASATQWADLIGQLFDRLTGKGAVISYSYKNLEVDIPKAAGPQGQTLGSAKWVVNGELVIKAQAQTSSEIGR
jgi:hypothetical protein